MADVVADLIARIQARLGHQHVRELSDIERQVRREWGGQYVYVGARPAPSADAIRQALATGTSARDIGRHLGISERHVRRIGRG